MPNHLSVATIIEANRIHSETAFLIALEVDIVDPVTNTLVETMRAVCNDEDITFNGQTYIATHFTVGAETAAGETPNITLSITDYTNALSKPMELYGGGVGFEARILVINSGALDAPPEISERFKVIQASIRSFVVSFTLGAENPLTMRCPTRLQYRDRCPWRYKGPQCGYAGDMPSCDYTLQGDNGCAAHGNNLRFGGFPGLMLRS
ncbi:hypothetical protein F1188_16355 [Roseospira marina]|uniref:Phage minor tail protein L n=1 Tax=Roseospira marina TaxID=140057 RepID=A0A5M6I9N3_9PROT|nr:hypothetical protein [Roseospira marina]KAA5604429.1 hypothetical protein F1188_16355 [Roseospira marina]MBB4315373.1 hypothetical protein [Roseospira marina]MBB5088482.1 hypothetical protein [Roseospira marina]